MRTRCDGEKATSQCSGERRRETVELTDQHQERGMHVSTSTNSSQAYQITQLVNYHGNRSHTIIYMYGIYMYMYTPILGIEVLHHCYAINYQEHYSTHCGCRSGVCGDGVKRRGFDIN